MATPHFVPSSSYREHKPYLETVPYLTLIFAQSYGLLPNGRKVKNYYVTESVGIAAGILLTALHRAGLASLTHTPSPMRFLNQILNQSDNERVFLCQFACFFPVSWRK